MTNQIEKYEAAGLAFNGRKAKATDDEIALALAPISVQHPHLEITDEWLRLHKMMLRDIDPNVLARAVLEALSTCEFPPTIAAIRKAAAVDGKREPGPASHVDPTQLKPIPMKMHRLDPEEDKRQRMAQLRRTKDWRYA